MWLGRTTQRIILPLLALVLLIGPDAYALDSPTGEVLLTIDGNIKEGNAKRGDELIAEFDLAMLRSLDKVTYKTRTPWTLDTEFTGVQVTALLKSVGVPTDAPFRASAADDYWFDISGIDFDRVEAIVAYERNGQVMTVRDLGPLWIVLRTHLD